jgi:hypothetical protein
MTPERLDQTRLRIGRFDVVAFRNPKTRQDAPWTAVADNKAVRVDGKTLGNCIKALQKHYRRQGHLNVQLVPTL